MEDEVAEFVGDEILKGLELGGVERLNLSTKERDLRGTNRPFGRSLRMKYLNERRMKPLKLSTKGRNSRMNSRKP